MSDKIKLVKGEQVVYTITVKRGGSVVDLTAHAAIGVSAVKMYARTTETGTTWDVVNAESILAYSDAANGVITFRFTTTHTGFTIDEGKGRWRLLLNDGAGTPTIEYTDPGVLEIGAV